jgi:hypothetical protein
MKFVRYKVAAITKLKTTLKLRKPKFPSSNVLASTKYPVRRKDVVLISASDKVEGKYKLVSLNIYEPSKTRNKKNLLLLCIC